MCYDVVMGCDSYISVLQDMDVTDNVFHSVEMSEVSDWFLLFYY